MQASQKSKKYGYKLKIDKHGTNKRYSSRYIICIKKINFIVFTIPILTASGLLLLIK